VVEELVSGVVDREYTYGRQRVSENQLISNIWTPSFYGYDGGGSVRQLTNAVGVVTDTYESIRQALHRTATCIEENISIRI